MSKHPRKRGMAKGFQFEPYWLKEEDIGQKKEVEGLLARGELYWRQRSRADWLVASDCNSKFFHARSSSRKLKNRISFLLDDKGRVQDSDEGLTKVISQYFFTLFQSTNPSAIDIRFATEFIGSKLSNALSNDLGEIFRNDEVKKTIFGMGPSKASGLDGFHAIFSRNSGVDVVYKTVTKVLANRLKTCLPTIISSNQSAFVPGSPIFDNVLVSFKILHLIARCKAGKTGFMVLKLDMSKAYDRIEWSFLKAIIEKMLFPPACIALVMDCISSSKLGFLLNGSKVCSIIPSRGLRQGCPLSPYLFLLCAEALSSLISFSENNGKALGVRCCRGSPLVSHLFFADDSVMFCNESSNSGFLIRKSLRIYEHGLGQQVNLQKSRITFSPNMADVVKRIIQDIFVIQDCNSQDFYLGI
ncbi:hypothetical protein Dsin_018691 [Dipteronia sinensis]|uniref:Reverse transcriptase domain-containing protein n=1 Tax=Dipteronia sinensis TaxID=43782 RepID=A0AAE0A5S5_9ROSI|nr:hypothetical protein Dsin_018691 [Dipteronia sinensis]